MTNKTTNKTFNTVNYSNITHIQILDTNMCKNSKLDLNNTDNADNVDNINNMDNLSSIIGITNSLNENNDDNRVLIFFYGIMSNINEIMTTLPNQIAIIKQNSLYLNVFKYSNDEKIAIATTLAFLLNLYYFI